MQNEDWLNRWHKNQIGFHEPQVNPYLTRHISRYDLKPEDSIFLPLCGKSVDINWLAQQGFKVIGVELSNLAIESFFSEQALEHESFESVDFITHSSGNIRLMQGSFFDLQSEDLNNCNLVYDRGALIALDNPNRQRYVDWMLSIITENTEILLITLNYNPAKMEGPPFAVSEAKVKQYYGERFEIEILEQNDIIDESPRWRNKGLSSLIETAYQLKPK